MTLSKKPLNPALSEKSGIKIGIFGTAANPPHIGHLKIVKCAKRFLRLDRTIVIPTKIPPHKDMPQVTPKARFQMTRLLFTDTPGVLVSDVEISRRGISYTKDTIAILKKKYSKDKLIWIIGQDSLANMLRDWEEGYGILDLCQFAVLSRKDCSLKKIPKDILAKVIMIKNCGFARESSTEIRDIASDNKKLSKMVGKKVYAYIKKHKLYEK